VGKFILVGPINSPNSAMPCRKVKSMCSVLCYTIQNRHKCTYILACWKAINLGEKNTRHTQIFWFSFEFQKVFHTLVKGVVLWGPCCVASDGRNFKLPTTTSILLAKISTKDHLFSVLVSLHLLLQEKFVYSFKCVLK
jgi:hypothetical protein